MDLTLPPQEGRLRALLFELNGVLDESINDRGEWQLRIRISIIDEQRLQKLLGYAIEKWQTNRNI
jgi:GTP-binding protein HflX